jgi:hypothetical protein
MFTVSANPGITAADKTAATASARCLRGTFLLRRIFSPLHPAARPKHLQIKPTFQSNSDAILLKITGLSNI